MPDRIRKLILVEARSFTELIVQHEAIVSTIERGDLDEVERNMRLHLRTILPDLERLRREHPAYFADDEGSAPDTAMKALA